MNISLPIILEVVTGLSFLYLILSLLASEIQESFTAFLQWRAKHLKKSIYRMLGGKLNSRELENALRTVDDSNTAQPSNSNSIPDLIQFFVTIPDKLSQIGYKTGGKDQKLDDVQNKIVKLVNDIYKTPLISSHTQSTLGFSRSDNSTSYLYGPDYIPSEIFADALIEVLETELNLNSDNNTSLSGVILEDIINSLKQEDQKADTDPKKNIPKITIDRLLAIAQKAALQKTGSENNVKDIHLFQTEIKNWFERSQNSAIGTYKRNSKFVLFWIGFAVAILVNADTLKMFHALYYQPAIREATIQSAINVVKQECESHDSTKPSTDCDTVINKEISNLENKNQIPIGWSKNSIINFNNTLNPDIIWRVLKKIIGLGISGFAIMMGASFWFDFLKKLANVRNANPLLDSDSTSPNSSTK